MKLPLFALAALILTGCSSGVVPAGPDTYMVSRSITIASSGGRAKAALYREASAYCAKRGLVMVPVATDAIEPAYGQHMGNAELTFRALKPGDPDIRRTNVESPDHTQRIQMR